MHLKNIKKYLVECNFEWLCLIISFFVKILTPEFIFHNGFLNFKTTFTIESQRSIFRFRLFRYIFALVIIKLDSNLLKKYFWSGSNYANLFIVAMTPAYKSIQKTKAEYILIKKAQENLHKSFSPKSLLIACLYLSPYEFDNTLDLFEEAMAHPDLAPLYICFLFNTQLFYTSPGDYEKHVNMSELAMRKMRILLENSDFNTREILATFLQYYVNGGISLSGYTNRRNYQNSKILLLLEYIKIKEIKLLKLPEYTPSTSVSLKKRIGLIRFSLANNREIELVLSATNNPPNSIELFLFVFELSEQDEQRVLNLHPYFKGNIRVLNLNDLAASLILIREHHLDLLINTSPLSGKFLNEISIILTFRAASVQAMYVSDIVSSGIPNMDYFIMPHPYWHNTLQDQFTETLLITKNIFEIILHRYSDNDTSKARLSFPKNNILFGSNAHIMKLSPVVLHAWAKILREVKNSRILLMPYSNESQKIYSHGLNQSILSVCSKESINPNRFIILDTSGRDNVCQYLSTCDIYLDTFPYNGSISINDLLIIKKPMVTLKGDQYCNRLASTILEELNLDEKMVAYTLEEYIALAVEQAQNKQLRDTLSNRIQTSLADHQHLFNSASSSIAFYQLLLSEFNKTQST